MLHGSAAVVTAKGRILRVASQEIRQFGVIAWLEQIAGRSFHHELRKASLPGR
jgi:hypothetical protein